MWMNDALFYVYEHACAYVCMHTKCMPEVKREHQIPGTGVTDDYRVGSGN